MKPLQTPEEVFEVAFAFMGSKALFAGLEIGVFDALADGDRCLADLVEKTGAQERGLLTLLTALASLGLLEKDGEHYRNAPASQAMLSHASDGGFGDYCRLQVDRQMDPFLHNIAHAQA